MYFSSGFFCPVKLLSKSQDQILMRLCVNGQILDGEASLTFLGMAKMSS